MTASVPGAKPTSVNKPGVNQSNSSGNVRVVSRIRPLAEYELKKGCQLVVTKVPHIEDENSASRPEALQVQGPEPRWFELDAVLDESCSQQKVYEKSGAYQAISEDLFQGFNCTILAYGQTGAGKTFTMGTAAKNVAQIEESDGVIPRAVKDLFDNIASKCDNHAQVELSYMEVYNEEIRDLMNPNEKGNADLRIRETMNGEVYVRGLQARTVSNPSEIGKLMEEASSRRVVASTKMNATSSRSHAICVLRVKGVLEDSTKFQSKLTLVDLAGSERIKKTEAKGNRAQEGININKGLFVLGQCVSALAEQRPKFKRKPPFRDSKLTRLLQDSLGGNSRTIMIACCSPADFNVEETINTLRYATQARNIKNSATANVVQTISQEEAMQLRRENELLKKQVEELQETIQRLTDDVTDEDMERSVSMMKVEQALHPVDISHRSTELVSPLPEPKTLNGTIKGKLPHSPELEVPPADDSDEDNDGGDGNGDDDDNDDDAVASEEDDEPRPLHCSPQTQPRRKGISLDDHFSSNPNLDTKSEEETSLALEDLIHGAGRSVVSAASHKSHQELEEKNQSLRGKLRRARQDMHASVKQSAIELPALRARVEMLEDELNNSMMIQTETDKLRQELEDAKADRKSALLAAQQLSEFMEQQKSKYGFRGDELEKKRLWYFHKRLDEKWVEFVVIMLSSFKEQMRLLGDYFEMVVRVVESPDILTMLGPQSGKKGWFGGFRHNEKAATEEANLRHTLLTEHIKFFNSRLLEIEDEITSRSESVDTMLEDVGKEREELESELHETEFVRDIFSKKGEKLLKNLTTMMTGPLFSTPELQGSMARLASR